MLYIDPRHSGPAIGLGAESGHEVDGLLAFGSTSSTCGALRSASVRRSWVEGCDGSASWVNPSSLGVSNFYNTATVHLVDPLEGLLLHNASLLSCSPGWGESGANIGRNRLVSAPSEVAIGNPSACPLAAQQKLLGTTGLAAKLPLRAMLAGERFGPAGRVGLEQGTPLLAEADLESAFAVAAEPCANGVDDDWDGAADLADAGCSDAVDASERRAGVACDDDIDNDGDGFADAGFDPGCPQPGSTPEDPACNDGIDNDGDGHIDFADPNCSATWPYAEAKRRSCGFGAELVLLGVLARRVARATSRRNGRRDARPRSARGPERLRARSLLCNAPMGIERPAAASQWRLETGVVSLGSERWRLDLSGPLMPGWAGNLAAGLSRRCVSVENGHARGSTSGTWSAHFEVQRLAGAPDLRVLDLGALLREAPEAAPGATLALDHFGLETALEHAGSLRVEIRAEDRVGFLAALLRRFAFFSLFPIELRLDTQRGRVVDEFFLRAGGDRAPSRTTADALRHALRALTAHPPD